MFFKIYRQLSSEFFLILVDMIGQGASSRPEDFDANTITAELALDYFCAYFEKWRIEMDNLTNFYLAGHSIGGYLVANYAARYSEHIKKLILISPIGVKVKPEDYTEADFDKKQESLPNPSSRLTRYFVKLAFRRRYSPFDFLRMIPTSKCLQMLKKYVSGRYLIKD